MGERKANALPGLEFVLSSGLFPETLRRSR
jgi:hypothetical protein